MKFWKLVVDVSFVCLFNFWVKIGIIKISDLYARMRVKSKFSQSVEATRKIRAVYQIRSMVVFI